MFLRLIKMYKLNGKKCFKKILEKVLKKIKQKPSMKFFEGFINIIRNLFRGCSTFDQNGGFIIEYFYKATCN